MKWNCVLLFGLVAGLAGCVDGADQSAKQVKLVDEVVLGEFGFKLGDNPYVNDEEQLNKTYAFIKHLKVALNCDDAKAFSKMVRYPLNIGTENGAVVVESEVDMVEAFPILFTKEWKLKVINMPMNKVFVNWRGVLIPEGNIWINDKIDYIAVYMGSDKRGKRTFFKSKGRVQIQPLKDKALMARVKQLGLPVKQNLSDSSVLVPMDGVDYLDVILQNGQYNLVKGGTPDPEIGMGSVGGSENMQLYVADINNDGQEDYILTYIWSGSMGGSGIMMVYTFKNGKRVSLPYFDLLVKSAHKRGSMISEWNDFSMMLASPFLYTKDGKVYHGFDNSEYYLWENESIKPVKVKRK